jgi:monofunctional biosynthetic peptidoglycan transglycosylase
MAFGMVGAEEKDTMKVLYEFAMAAELDDWRIVNDGVMGGVSESALIMYAQDSTAVFSGHVSFENNGGFASVRTLPRDFNIDGFDGVLIRVKGDGKSYQFRLRTGAAFDGVAYKQHFDTRADEWQIIRLPFSEFAASYRGRVLPHIAPPDPAQVNQIGLLIADKQEGAFTLTVDWIKVYSSLEK